MASYNKGDVVLVWQVWENEDGTTGMKKRPGIIYDVIAEDHYCILIYGKDRSGKIPGFQVKADSVEGKMMRLKKDSFINLSRFIKLQKMDILRLIGLCSEQIMEKIEEIIDDEGIERPLN